MTKILLIEDDRMLLDMYQKLLKFNGYEVLTAKNGKEGLKLALLGHPDVILLDIRMPIMDGMTMLKLLREDSWGQGAKVIINTNYDASEHLLQGVTENHPTYYLIKSNTSPESLIEHIKQIVEEPLPTEMTY